MLNFRFIFNFLEFFFVFLISESKLEIRVNVGLTSLKINRRHDSAVQCLTIIVVQLNKS
jgi:hypothetical protein